MSWTLYEDSWLIVEVDGVIVRAWLDDSIEVCCEQMRRYTCRRKEGEKVSNEKRRFCS